MDSDGNTLAYAAGGLVGFCVLVIVVVLVVRSTKAGKADDFVKGLAQIMQLRKMVGDRDALCAAIGFSPFMLPSGSTPEVYVGRLEGIDLRVGSVRWAPKGAAERTDAVAFVKLPRELVTKFELATEVWAQLSPIALAGHAASLPYAGGGSVRAGDPEAAIRLLGRDPQVEKRVHAIMTQSSQLGRVSNESVRGALDTSKPHEAVIDDIGYMIFVAKKLCE
jgi:hypothetical protein